MSSRLTQVLCVAEDFDGFGGASLELVAWELGVEVDVIRTAWEQAIDRSLLAIAARDRIFDEEMFRLTARGRARLAADSSRLVTSPAQSVYELRFARTLEPVGRMHAPELAPSIAR